MSLSGALAGALSGALAQPGLGWLLLAAALAGLVRGFSGFGSGLVFMPLAGMVLPPVQAVALLVIVDMIGPLPNLPGAARTGNPREIGRLGVGLLVGLPLGFAALLAIPAEAFRWTVSLMGLGMVAALAAGWRYLGPRGPKVTAGAGFLSGVVGGATALPGPPVILYYMASPLPVAEVRANLMMFLVMVDVGLALVLGATGRLDPATVALAFMLLVPFTAANFAGAHLFDPARTRTYRALSYAIIAGAALAGLPLVAG